MPQRLAQKKLKSLKLSGLRRILSLPSDPAGIRSFFLGFPSISYYQVLTMIFVATFSWIFHPILPQNCLKSTIFLKCCLKIATHCATRSVVLFSKIIFLRTVNNGFRSSTLLDKRKFGFALSGPPVFKSYLNFFRVRE